MSRPGESVHHAFHRLRHTHQMVAPVNLQLGIDYRDALRSLATAVVLIDMLF
ncbi:MAG: hypothetical protein QNJ05_06725 [Woeseiaceae bacterium]|nr:hypothetical protein [Woeseiaceae bacterium]